MGEGEGVRIREVGSRAVVQLKSHAAAPRDGRGMEGLLFGSSLVLPDLQGQLRILVLGPGQCLAISDTIEGAKLRERLLQHLVGQDIAAVDLSCGLKTLRVEGAATLEVLGKGCGLDLHPRSFPAGHCTRTRFAQLAVIIECTDLKPCFELYVGRSYASYLKAWLADAANMRQHTAEERE
jgi:sarcosine oxidase, subunit gamma